jgi:hypothetical protein
MAKPTAQPAKKQKKDEAQNGHHHDHSESIQLSEDDAATVRSAEMAIMEQHRQLGVAREQYLVTEARIAPGIGEARKKYQSVVQTMAQKRGIDLTKEPWTFNQQTMVFSKAPPVQ